MERQANTCKQRIEKNLTGRLADIRAMFKAEQEDKTLEDLGPLSEYGLCFDYVAPEKRHRGFWRWQLSTGGPGDEFRFYAERSGRYTWNVDRIEYWFLDWFDGAHKVLSGGRLALLTEVWECMFSEIAAGADVRQKAMDW